VAGGAGDATVHDQLVGLFRDLGVEVVHQHPQRGFGQPRLGTEPGASRSAYAARRVDARVAGARGRKIVHCVSLTLATLEIQGSMLSPWPALCKKATRRPL